MKYTIDIEVNDFQDKQLRAKAKMKEVSPKDILGEIVADKVIAELNAMIDDVLNTKLSKIDAGLALARLDAMD